MKEYACCDLCKKQANARSRGWRFYIFNPCLWFLCSDCLRWIKARRKLDNIIQLLTARAARFKKGA